jgi:hypothetical protein
MEVVEVVAPLTPLQEITAALVVEVALMRLLLLGRVVLEIRPLLLQVKEMVAALVLLILTHGPAVEAAVHLMLVLLLLLDLLA